MPTIKAMWYSWFRPAFDPTLREIHEVVLIRRVRKVRIGQACVPLLGPPPRLPYFSSIHRTGRPETNLQFFFWHFGRRNKIHKDLQIRKCGHVCTWGKAAVAPRSPRLIDLLRSIGFDGAVVCIQISRIRFIGWSADPVMRSADPVSKIKALKWSQKYY